MKTIFTLKLVLLFLIAITLSLSAQYPTYEARLMNGVITAPNTLEFDIYIKRTGTEQIEISALQVGLLFNDAIRNGGSLSAAYISGSSDMNVSQIPKNVSASSLISGKALFRLFPRIPHGPGTGTIISSIGNGTRLGRFRISTSASSFSNLWFDFEWNFSVFYWKTIIIAYVDSLEVEITNQLFHFNDLCFIDINQVPTYEARLINDTLINADTYEFEIYFKATNSAIFTLHSSKICLLFDNLISGGGELSSTYEFGSSQLSYWQIPGNPDILDLIAGKRVWSLTITSPPELSMCTSIATTGMGTRIGRFKITNTSGSFAHYRPNLTWNFDNIVYGFRTQIFFGYYLIPMFCGALIDITNPSVHYNNLSNPILPVELVSFHATVTNDKNIFLEWSTSTETNNYGFEVQRKVLSRQSTVSGNEFEKIGFVEGSGNSSTAKHYSFVDNKLSGGNKFAYRLKQMDHDGTYSYSSIQEVELTISKYELTQNYPNPFNPATTIEYSLPQAGNVLLTLYNLLGEKVEEIVNEYKESGIYKVDLDASNLTSGVYIYVLIANGNTISKKMTILR